jgi:hypothetical protein
MADWIFGSDGVAIVSSHDDAAGEDYEIVNPGQGDKRWFFAGVRGL